MKRSRMLMLAVLLWTVPAALVGVAASPAHAAPAPAGYPIGGIDVSAYQGTVDWASVAAGGAQFAYIRASEQDGIPDATFDTNYPAAKANGLYAGAYHRARPDLSGGTAQADYLIDHARYVEDGRTLPPMLDIEWPRSSWPGLSACYNMSAAQLVTWIHDFVAEVGARTGRLATIYTNPNWWNPCTGGNTGFGAYPLFNSGYLASPPAPPAGWSTWTFWQYSDAGTLPGDQDVFNGDFAALARLAGGTPMALYAHANGRYVTAESAGASSLVANRTAIGPWELFDQIDAGGGYVALRSHANGRLVTAEGGGAQPLIANRLVIGLWERFRVTVNADGSVSLRAAANDRYVTAEGGGAQPLIANRTAIGLWEMFDEVPPPALIGLKAQVNGRYVCAEGGGAQPLYANRDAMALWEQFDQLNAGGGYLALRSRANGRYVTAENAGALALIANRTAVGPWEKFRAVVRTDGTVSLVALANGRVVTVPDRGAAPLVASAGTVGTAELFRRVPA